jgi:hypothetical protein
MSTFAHAGPSASLPYSGMKSKSTAARLLRGVLVTLTILGAVAVLAHFGLAFWAQNEFTQPESIVAVQSRMLDHTGHIYYALKDYPYTVCAYMPIGYEVQAILQGVGVPALLAGRLVSMAALCCLMWLVWRILLLYSGDQRCAWLGLALCGCTSGLPFWGTVGQVDMLAVTLALGAFYQFSRYWMTGAASLPWASLLIILALFTKQTVVAAPAAIAIALWLRQRNAAMAFVLVTAGTGLALVLAVDWMLAGRFLANTVYANINPYAWEKVEQHGMFWLIASAQLALITATGVRRLWQSHMSPVLVYAGLALLIFVATAGKIGSDSNYQLESSVLLIVTACLTLHVLGFYDLVFTDSKSWVPLLVMPLLVHAVLNLRLEQANLLGRLAKEMQFQEQTAKLPGLVAPSGRILSADSNVLVHLKRPLEVEPLIYRLLVEAGRIDPERLRADLAAARFSTVVLYHDLEKNANLHAEIPTLTKAQLAAVREQYRKVAFVPGPNAGGLHIYLPKAAREKL